MVTYKETPGNATVSTLAYQRQLLKGAEQLVRVEYLVDRQLERGVELRGFSVRFPAAEGGEYLATVRAVVEGKATVGFHASVSLFETLRGLFARLEGGTIKWKDDEYE